MKELHYSLPINYYGRKFDPYIIIWWSSTRGWRGARLNESLTCVWWYYFYSCLFLGLYGATFISFAHCKHRPEEFGMGVNEYVRIGYYKNRQLKRITDLGAQILDMEPFQHNAILKNITQYIFDRVISFFFLGSYFIFKNYYSYLTFHH
jgi:hypothetical protein